MYNWSHIDEEEMKRRDPEKYRLWWLIQLINYGPGEEKLDRDEVKAAWPKIKDEIEPYTRRAVEYILWDTVYSLPVNLKWWMPYIGCGFGPSPQPAGG